MACISIRGFLLPGARTRPTICPRQAKRKHSHTRMKNCLIICCLYIPGISRLRRLSHGQPLIRWWRYILNLHDLPLEIKCPVTKKLSQGRGGHAASSANDALSLLSDIPLTPALLSSESTNRLQVACRRPLVHVSAKIWFMPNILWCKATYLKYASLDEIW